MTLPQASKWKENYFAVYTQNTLKHGHFGTTAAHFIDLISFSNWAKYWVKYV